MSRSTAQRRLIAVGRARRSWLAAPSTIARRVYRSDFAGTNKATAATWAVGDQLDAIVGALRDKGVSFEHYDIPGTTREGDIHVLGDEGRGVWLKDPDGNIIGLVDQ